MPHSGRILCRDVIPSAARSGGPRRAYRTRALRMRHGIIFRSRTGLRCLPVFEMGSPDVVTGRRVGSRVAPVTLQEQEPSHKWEELKAHVEGERINK